MTNASTDDARAQAQELLRGVHDGDQLALSRLITHLENQRPGYENVVKELYAASDDPWTIGITGPPGAGKSTIVDKLVDKFRQRGDSVGVIAVDPSSPYSGGSVLGDRIRQQSRHTDMDVFFRSMSARGHQGGIAEATFDVVHALGAFGKEVVIVETVGAGQSEVEIVKTADTVGVVIPPAAGDDVQANKAGILEIADIFILNKADMAGVERTQNQLEQMLRIGEELDGTETVWRPRILPTVATKGEGIDELINTLDDHYSFLADAGKFVEQQSRRFSQEVRVHAQTRIESLLDELLRDADVGERTESADPYTVADEVVAPLEQALDQQATESSPED